MTTAWIERINFYAGAQLDRAGHVRRDDAWLRARLTVSTTRLVPVAQSQNLIRRGKVPAAGLPSVAEAEALLQAGRETVFLGIADDTAYFAVDVDERDETVRATLAPHGEFLGLRTVGSVLDRREAALLAYARGLMHWHERTRFCSVCGSPTRSAEAGHVRVCTSGACGAQHHPRTDPAVIMLVERGGRCLLGRQAAWPKGMYSTLAGFVEPGESLEETVEREVYEEAGVRVTAPRYQSSQPWPFPASLMVGFRAEAVTDTIAPRAPELEDVRWFDRDWLLQPHDELAFRLPPALSIARQLIDDWLDEA